MSETSGFFAKLSEAQRKLFELRLKRRAGAGAFRKKTLVPIQPKGKKKPFFCAHSALGSVGYYINVARYLSQDRPFYGIKAAGLWGEREPFDNIGDMAQHYCREIVALEPEGPYLLGGHSTGGIVAFEMARQLRQDGREVALLALLDTQMPEDSVLGPEDMDPVAESPQLWVHFTQAMALVIGQDVAVREEDLVGLSMDEQLDMVIHRSLDAGALPNQVKILPKKQRRALVRRILRVLKANTAAVSGYELTPYEGRISLIQVGDDPQLVADWQRFSSEPLQLFSVSGTHVSMMGEPYVREVAAHLGSCLDALSD